MVMLSALYDFVIGGDPDRDTIDLAVLDAATGGVLAHTAERADGAGYARLLAWAQQRPCCASGASSRRSGRR